MNFENRMNEIIAGHRLGRCALWMMSLLYQAGITLRHYAYRFNLLSSKKVAAVVVSVGNIVVGGVGKTPLVHFLAQELSKKNSIAILSRGYRSLAEKQKHPAQVQSTMRADEVGDEPLWLAQKLPQVQVWVGVDRYQSAQKAIENGAEILILDDGFQHRRLYRDFEVVVVAGEQPLGNGYFLPRGYLRDLPLRLSEATVLAIMGSPSLQLPQAPNVIFQRTTSMYLKEKKVALFCAIANPHRFIQQVKLAGAQLVASLIKEDHAFFSGQEIEDFALQSEADLLICTEKDFVKLPSVVTPMPVVAVPLELQLQEGKEIWKQFIKKIQLQVDHVRRLSSYTS